MNTRLTTTIMPMTKRGKRLAQMRLWQLISPALPIGSYAYSQGLEAAVEAGWVHDETSAASWIRGVLTHGLMRVDVPVMQRLYHAWQAEDMQKVHYWNNYILAMREAAELREEDRQQGLALMRLLNDLGVKQACFIDREAMSVLSLFSLATVAWQIDLADASHGYLWSWCENQVAAAIKLVPLGQTAGQRILSTLVEVLATQVEPALQLDDEAIGGVLPGLALASAWHETQYSRLFRS